MNTYTTKKAAEILEISPHTLRYYDRIDLVKPERRASNYRLYDDADIIRLKYIQVLKFTGCSLEEIKTIMDLYNGPITPECMTEINTFMAGKEVQLINQIQQLQSILTLIQGAEKNIGLETNKRNELISSIYASIQSIE